MLSLCKYLVDYFECLSKLYIFVCRNHNFSGATCSNKRRNIIPCARYVSRITFITYAQGQKNGKPYSQKGFRNQKTKGFT